MENEEERERRNYNSGGGILGLIIFVVVGWWVFNTFIKNNDKPWFTGNEPVQVCSSLNSGCVSANAVSVGHEITNVYINGNVSESGFFQSSCGKDETGRYCMGELRNGTFLFIRE